MGIHEFSWIWLLVGRYGTRKSVQNPVLCASCALLRRRIWQSIFYVVHGALQQDIFDKIHHHSPGFLDPGERIFLCKSFGEMFCALGQKLLVLRLTPIAGMDLCWDFQAPEKGKTLSMPIYLGSFFTLCSLTTWMLVVLRVCFSLWADYNLGYSKMELLFFCNFLFCIKYVRIKGNKEYDSLCGIWKIQVQTDFVIQSTSLKCNSVPFRKSSL